MRILIGLYFIIFFNINSVADELVISSKLSLHYPKPNLIAHTGGVLISKYENWYFSHELIDPESFYGIVDLTGVEHLFMKSMFGLITKGDLPEWMILLAKEQAKSFGITKSNTLKSRFELFDIFSNYLPNAQEGNIFILEKYQVHRINVHGNENKYKLILKAIKERDYES